MQKSPAQDTPLKDGNPVGDSADQAVPFQMAASPASSTVAQNVVEPHPAPVSSPGLGSTVVAGPHAEACSTTAPP
jgi:hypothetical protein